MPGTAADNVVRPVGRRGRRRWAPAVVGALLVVGTAGCGRSDGGAGAGQGDVGRPLDEVVVDHCGNDLSAMTTTVRGIDPTTGAVRWTATVPLADHYLLRSEAGNPQVPLVRRSVEVELDRATGEVVAYPPAGAHEVLVDVAAGTMTVDGDVQPATAVVGGLTLSTGYGAAVDGVQALTATDASGVVVWTVPLTTDGSGGSVGRPTVFGDLVVVTSSPPVPVCSAQS